jgi:hypothetical protein
MVISDCDGRGGFVAVVQHAFGWIHSPHAAAWDRRLAEEMSSAPALNEVMMPSVAAVAEQTV